MRDDGVLAIMVVDDEFLVRIGIRRTIAWEKHGFVIAGEAENGEEGLEMAKRLRPDIIITDIRMPNMDGLMFMARLREEGIDAKIIVLSGYDEFEYAREALKHGALAYLLKPIENRQLLETVESAGRAIREERELARRYSDLEQELPGVVKYQLIRAIDGAAVSPGAADLEKIGIPAKAAKIAVVIRIDEYELLKANHDAGTIIRLEQSMASIEENEHARLVVLEKSNGEWVLIVALALEKAQEFCQDIIRLLYERSKLTPNELTFSVGISREFLDIAEIGRAYAEAFRASEFKLVPRSNSIRHIDEVYQANTQDYLYQAINFLRSNYAKEITVETVANNLSLSPSYLMHLFKSKLGKTFGECLAEFRISVAKELLREPGCKVYEVSDRVGYKDPKYFSQIFRRATGLTPKDYAKVAGSWRK